MPMFAGREKNFGEVRILELFDLALTKTDVSIARRNLIYVAIYNMLDRYVWSDTVPILVAWTCVLGTELAPTIC